ncbi:hypothetical protein BDW_03695 [Bdellovibrio bacteriovorus W]|nr:hypothetical protein BDW_03695 [Bdellovibrio bacteriovorus W]
MLVRETHRGLRKTALGAAKPEFRSSLSQREEVSEGCSRDLQLLGQSFLISESSYFQRFLFEYWVIETRAALTILLTGCEIAESS